MPLNEKKVFSKRFKVTFFASNTNFNLKDKFSSKIRKIHLLCQQTRIFSNEKRIVLTHICRKKPVVNRKLKYTLTRTHSTAQQNFTVWEICLRCSQTSRWSLGLMWCKALISPNLIAKGDSCKRKQRISAFLTQS